MANEVSGLKRAVPELLSNLRNVLARARNAVVDRLPGKRPKWLVLEVSGSFPARRRKQKFGLLATVLGSEREHSQEEFSDTVSALLRAPCLDGVVLRFGELRLDLATAFALRNQIARLTVGGKRVVVVANDLNSVTYYLAAAADEIVSPESANFWVHGMALSTTFMAEALGRYGVRFEKLAIEEFKNSGDQFALTAMSESQRRQYDALLDSMERSYLEAVGADRNSTAAEVQAWIDKAVTSAAAAQELGMIDRVAYEDELLGKQHKSYGEGARFLPSGIRTFESGRVAVVSLEGVIVPGRSRRSPLPLPLFGSAAAGSETIVRALRAAARDPTTAAVVFFVNSGGGSALASDLIWREVKLLAARKPLVAVMGQYAASGGYYVLTHATRVVAAPTTLTGSIGVLMGKFVLEEFNTKYGFNPETLSRGRFAAINESSHGWDEPERELLEQYNSEIYERFIARVADGRELTLERVHELGRGRVWSGADALELGLVDELGDVHYAIGRAKELAGLHPDAPVWNVKAPQRVVLPASSDPAEVLSEWIPLLRERALLLHPFALRLE